MAQFDKLDIIAIAKSALAGAACEGQTIHEEWQGAPGDPASDHIRLVRYADGSLALFRSQGESDWWPSADDAPDAIRDIAIGEAE